MKGGVLDHLKNPPTEDQMREIRKNHKPSDLDIAATQFARRRTERQMEGDLAELLEGYMAEELEKRPRHKIDSRELQNFGAFAVEFGLSPCPAAPATVAAYLHRKLMAGASAASIRKSCQAIAHAHHVYSYADPTTGPLVEVIKKVSKHGKGN